MPDIGLRSVPDTAQSVAARGALPRAFDTPQGEAAYIAAYEANMQFWPVPYDTLDLTSRFGITHVVASGPLDAPPLVLLHGYSGSLTMWWPNIADLCRHYRVYAVDVIGQPGKSVPTRPIASRGEYVEWLTTLLDALDIEQTYLAGMSYGGWLTLNYAIAAPARVRKIALLSPAGGFVPLTEEFYQRSVRLMSPTPAIAEEFMSWAGAEDIPDDWWMRDRYDRLVKQFYLGLAHFEKAYAAAVVPPDVFSDDELRAMRVPTLLLIGENEPLYDAEVALTRAACLLPRFEGELIPLSSHMMSFTKAAVVDARILAFFEGTEAITAPTTGQARSAPVVVV